MPRSRVPPATTTLPFGKFKGETLSLGLRAGTLVPCLVPRDRGRVRGGQGGDQGAGRHRGAPDGVPAEAAVAEAAHSTQQEVEWLTGKFSAQTVDKVCEELFDGEG